MLEKTETKYEKLKRLSSPNLPKYIQECLAGKKSMPPGDAFVIANEKRLWESVVPKKSTMFIFNNEKYDDELKKFLGLSPIFKVRSTYELSYKDVNVDFKGWLISTVRRPKPENDFFPENIEDSLALAAVICEDISGDNLFGLLHNQPIFNYVKLNPNLISTMIKTLGKKILDIILSKKVRLTEQEKSIVDLFNSKDSSPDLIKYAIQTATESQLAEIAKRYPSLNICASDFKTALRLLASVKVEDLIIIQKVATFYMRC